MHRCLLSLSVLLTVGAFLAGCETPPPQRPPLPPSESDLDLLKSTKLCDSRKTFKEAHPGTTPQVQAWGSGQELRIPQEQSLSKGEESAVTSDRNAPILIVGAGPTGLTMGCELLRRNTRI